MSEVANLLLRLGVASSSDVTIEGCTQPTPLAAFHAYRSLEPETAVLISRHAAYQLARDGARIT